MSRKSEVLNIRVTERQRATYERAAAVGNTTVSALVTGAADAAAADVLATQASMALPEDLFDALVNALDDPKPLSAPLARVFEHPSYENR